ncbi:MAG: histidinol-phosphate transaminase [Gammaproteobacteria bacterium]
MITSHFINLAKSTIHSLSPYQPGKPIEEIQREFGVEHIIKLGSNENPLGASAHIPAAIAKVTTTTAIYPNGSSYYLLHKLAEYLQVSYEQVMLGSGSDEILSLLIQAFTMPGQEVMVSQYGFAMYSIFAKAHGAQVITVPAQEWGCDLMAMLDAITPNTKLIFIANPNNPTGTWISHDALQQFLHDIPRHVLVVIDEAYYEYMQAEKLYPNSLALQKHHDNLVITRTFSKIYGLASLRVGYAIAHPEIVNILNRIRLPFNVNAAASAAAMAALDDQTHVAKSYELNQAGRTQLLTAFKQLQLDVIGNAGNFITVKIGTPAMSIYQNLLKSGIIVRSLLPYNMNEYLRITIGLPDQNQSVIDNLAQLLKA